MRPFNMPILFKLFMRIMPLLFWSLMILTTVLMLIELKPHASGMLYVDKIQHALVFMLLTLSGLLAYAHKKWFVLSGLTLFGIVIELLQGMYTLTRQASVADWIADVVGIILMISLIGLNKK